MSDTFTVDSLFDYNPLLSFLEAESLFNKIQSSIPPEIGYIYPNLVSDILEEAEDPFILSLDYYQSLLNDHALFNNLDWLKHHQGPDTFSLSYCLAPTELPLSFYVSVHSRLAWNVSSIISTWDMDSWNHDLDSCSTKFKVSLIIRAQTQSISSLNQQLLLNSDDPLISVHL